MNFDFSAEQYMFQDSVRAYLADAWSVARLRRLMEGDGFDATLWHGLTDLGLLSILVPEEHGGMGLSFVDLALVFEECGRALVPGPAVETMIATDVLARFGTQEQKAALLPGIATGRIKVVPAVVEADGGSDPAEVETIASDAAGGWVLNGRKILVPYAGLADKLLVSARFGATAALGLALVDPTRAGLTLRPQALFDPSSRACEVIFDNVAIGSEDVVGAAPIAASVDRVVDAGAMAAAAQMTGIAARMLDLAVDYAAQRVQFGRPIGSFQAIKHRCADMMVQVETSRTAAYYAAWALSCDAPEAVQAVSMAKAYCGDAARFVCNEALQIHGGVGFAWDLDLHFYLRRAKTLEYSFGDASAHRERVLSAALAAREAA